MLQGSVEQYLAVLVGTSYFRVAIILRYAFYI